MSVRQLTTAEQLNREEYQRVALEKIIDGLRKRGEWGKYGLFSKIGEKIDFSASYVSKSLTGKKPLRVNFVSKMADYLEVNMGWFFSENSVSYEEARREQFEISKLLTFGEIGEFADFIGDRVVKEFKHFRELATIFCQIPVEERDRALELLHFLKDREL